MKKRTFLLTAVLAGGAVMVGWGLMPPRQRLHGSSALPLDPARGSGQVSLNGWISLAPDGTVGLVMPRAEMGQGAHTGLAMLVAEELDCPLSNIRLLPAPIDTIYGNVAGLAEGVPFHPDDQSVTARSARWVMHKFMREMGFMMTGGSASIKDLWLPLREAAAMTRASLLAALAAHWNVTPSQISVNNGVFSVTPEPGKSLSLAQVVTQFGTKLQAVSNFAPKALSEFRLLGKPAPRIDIVGKVDGSAKFGIDVLLPDMLHAAIRLSPVIGARVAKFDASKAITAPGVVKVVQVEPSGDASGGVVVIAKHYWAALKALDLVQVEWTSTPLAAYSSKQIEQTLQDSFKSESGFEFYKSGDVDKVLSEPKLKRLSAEYQAPYLAHAVMEPMNCTVLLDKANASAQVWVGTQVPDFARKAAAKGLGLKDDAVVVHTMYLGGGFGRRLEIDTIYAAAQVAKQMPGTPVKLIVSREEDVRHDFYRPAAISRFEAALDTTATQPLLAWKNTSAGQNIVPQYMARNAGLPLAGPDKTSSEGAFDQPYELPNSRIAHIAVDLPVPVGFWRSVGHSHQAFFKESFIDECAHAAGVDAFLFRKKLFAKHPRHLAVLERLVELSAWHTKLVLSKARAAGTGSAAGISLHESFGSIVGQVAEVSQNPDKSIRVEKVFCVIDCGFVVNPNLIKQQVESSIVFGLSAALFGRITFDQGKVQQSNYHDYPVLRANQCPTIETFIMPSTRPPEGVGEPAVPPIAPAVANAWFNLTAQRLRQLPFSL